jgi:hypothetical protein
MAHKKKKRDQHSKSKPKPISAQVSQENSTQVVGGETAQKENKNMGKWTNDSAVHRYTLLVGIAVALIYFFQLLAIRQTVTITKESVEAVQRAFVKPNGFEIQLATDRQPSGDVRRWWIKAKWENVGATTAKSVVTYISVDDSHNDEPNEINFKGMGNPSGSVMTFIPPKGGIDTGIVEKPESFLPINLQTPPDLRSTVQTTKQLYFWSWVAYRDEFPDTKPHVTEVCQKMVSAAWPTLPAAGGPTPQWENCKRHNCTDEDCEDYSLMTSVLPSPK